MAIESEVVFIRGARSAISNVEKIDGQLLIETDDNSSTTDSNVIYMDANQNGTVNRFAIGGTPQSLISRIETFEDDVENDISNIEDIVSTFNNRITTTENFITDNEILVATD